MDLSLIPIEDLIEEIDKRTDANVILTLKVKGNNELHEFHFFGGHMIPLGLAEQFVFNLKSQKQLEETDGFYQD